MLARKAACYQLRLGDAIGRNVYTARFNGRNFPTTRHLNARDILRARTQCDFFHQFVHKARVYLERDGGDVTRVNIPPPPPPPPPRYARAGTLRTRHNRHHAALGTQSTIVTRSEETDLSISEMILQEKGKKPRGSGFMRTEREFECISNR